MLEPPEVDYLKILPRSYLTAFGEEKTTFLLFGDIERQLVEVLTPYFVTEPEWSTKIIEGFKRSRELYYNAKTKNLPGVNIFLESNKINYFLDMRRNFTISEKVLHYFKIPIRLNILSKFTYFSKYYLISSKIKLFLPLT